MKKPIIPGPIPNAWDPEAIFQKAMIYAQNMTKADTDDWERVLWSSLTIELLARAALANIHPALLADTGNNSWENLYNALGFPPKSTKYVPLSVATNEVFNRLSKILPAFTKEILDFSTEAIVRRNSELHSGEIAFNNIAKSNWQPRFYQVCEVLLSSMDKTLEEFVGKNEAEIAKNEISAAADKSAAAVRGDIEAHMKVWNAKSSGEMDILSGQAAVWATRHAGHRVDCPACN